MTFAEFERVLAAHAGWMASGLGLPADLSDAVIPPAPAGARGDAIVLSGAALRRADFTGIKALRDGRFQGADLRGANLAGLVVAGADFSGADLGRADLRIAGRDLDFGKAALAAADLSCALIEDSSFDDADLSRSDLSGARIEGSSFHQADLSGADCSGLGCDCVLFTAACFHGARLRSFHAAHCWFPEADLAGVRWSGSIGGAVFHDADLRRADFTGCRLADVNFYGADLRGADFSGAVLERVGFARADLGGAVFPEGFVPDAAAA
jgi:uncharacterized protein YjbI with pentapeptide repeats